VCQLFFLLNTTRYKTAMLAAHTNRTFVVRYLACAHDLCATHHYARLATLSLLPEAA
jgi:hypothetical protein